MSRKHKRKTSEIVIREGEPAAVTLEIDKYQKILERLRRYGRFENVGTRE